MRRVIAGRREQLALQRRVVELRRYRPRDADHRRPPDILSDPVRPIPTEREITRSLAPQAYFRRRTSRTFRIGNLSAGIVASPLLESQRDDLASLRLPTTLPVSPYPQGGRLRSESVAAFDRIGWPPSVGIGGRFASDSAVIREYIRNQEQEDKRLEQISLWR